MQVLCDLRGEVMRRRFTGELAMWERIVTLGWGGFLVAFGQTYFGGAIEFGTTVRWGERGRRVRGLRM